MFCENCGSQVADHASFCPECGKPLAAVEPEEVRQKRGHQPYDYGQQMRPVQMTSPVQDQPQMQGQPQAQSRPVIQEPPQVVQKQTVYTRKLPIIVIILLTLGFFGVGIMGGIGGLGLSMATATIPGLVLIVLIYRLDRIEPEPVGLLVKLFLLGGTVGIIGAMSIGTGLDKILVMVFPEGSFFYCLIDAFIVAALVEELLKYMILRICTWKHPAFNYRFDGVVYSTTVAIGFDIIEDLLFMIGSSAGTAFSRAAFPGHCVFGIYMGYYYGQAKTFELKGDTAKAAAMRRKGIFIAVGLHGLYDFCCMYGQSAPDLVAVLMVLAVIVLMTVLNVTAYKNIKKYAQEDTQV
ncbi:MAG: PrsW family intramembrane metalloprotease [Lachnospiraceae bacterium]|nr:PrsW family intramembrane metalloprotease [Lachnospiraceae bacterium]